MGQLAKVKWLNAFLAFLAAMVPPAMDYVSNTHWVKDNPQAYGMIVLVVGLLTKFYKHNDSANPQK